MIKEELENLKKLFSKVKPQSEISKIQEIGIVISIDNGIAKVTGLKKAEYQEIVFFEHGERGIAYDLDFEEIGVILLDDYSQIRAGSKVKRGGKSLEIPVSEDFLGKIINPLGDILDESKYKKKAENKIFYPLERDAPAIMDRSEVNRPLQTGIKVIDSIIPIGRGQRELILGERQTGKTAIAVDTILNQKDKNIVCIYCAIGQKNSSVVKVVETLKKFGAMDYTTVVVAESSSPVGMSFIAPYASTALGEYFLDQQRDVLIVYDDLSKHARCYREISLLLQRPPGREAYPGDIFYLHSKLLERSTQMKEEMGGGSITALPIVEVEGDNISAYIPTNLISITDGQIYLSGKLFQRGEIPSVKVGNSVSRVGGKSQLPAYREITRDLKLFYSQFEEIESFENLSTRLDEETKKILVRGKRIRKILSQNENSPMDVAEQIGVLLAVIKGAFDKIELENMKKAEFLVREIIKKNSPMKSEIYGGKYISEEIKENFIEEISEILIRELGEESGKS